jgi:hypothetical protein
MANILTVQQAANALRVETTDARMLDLLTQVDLFIQRATGRDWTQDTAKNVTAVSAATMLLVQWFDNPSMIGDQGSLYFGLTAALNQLEVEALKYRKYEFEGLNGGGSIFLPGAREGDDVIKLVGIFNASGSQTSAFESEISEEGYLKQLSTSNLSETIFVVVLKSPADDVDV